jgi:hypothetical protein
LNATVQTYRIVHGILLFQPAVAARQTWASGSVPVSWDDLPEVHGAADWNVKTGIAEAEGRLGDSTAFAAEQEITERMRRAVRVTA